MFFLSCSEYVLRWNGLKYICEKGKAFTILRVKRGGARG